MPCGDGDLFLQLASPQSEFNKVRLCSNLMKCKLRNGVLASKYGIVIPKPVVEQQSAKQGCCLPEVSHLVKEARHSPIKQLEIIVCRLLCVT